MKKILFVMAIFITLGLTAKAQSNNDAFFSGWEDNDRFSDSGLSFILPISHGLSDDSSLSPLGSGLLVLTALGTGYAVTRKRK